MKRVIFLLLIISSWAQAQITPSTSKLYIQSSTARVSTTNPADLSDPTKGITTVSYMDGMGRSLQQVSYRTSPDTLDMVQGAMELDALGRPKLRYLPVQSASQNGSYQAGYAGLAQSFYGDTAPYSEVDSYDASPISSPIKSIAPGQAYQAGSKKGVVENYETAGAGIRKYVIQTSGTIDGTQTYSNGDLLKTTLVDEDGNTSIEYTGGKSGRLLLVQQKDRNSSTYLSTAYVYDFMGRLCYIVPPKAYNSQNTFIETGSYFDEGIYATHYDGRGRAVESHVPGGGWTYTVYNELDQPVMSQDARQRESNLWTWIKYDGHGRPVMGGTFSSSSSRSTLQDAFLAFTANEQFEERSTAGGNLYGYTNKSFPTSITLAAGDVCNVTYYDDYNWVNNTALNYQAYKSSQWTNVKGMATGNLVKNLGNGQMLKSVVYYDDRGRVIQTHTQNRFGGINQTDAVLNFAGDLLEERSIYRKPGADSLQIRKFYAYDHVGRLLQAYHQVNNVEPEAIAGYEYDGIGRMTVKKLNAAGETSIVRNAAIPDQTYDLAGRSVTLLPGTYTPASGVYLAKVSGEYVQKVDYAYNIQGQLRSINGGVLNSTEHDLFALTLDYFETAQTYNGKLNKQSWASLGSGGSAQTRSFTYGYDGYDRLNAATYTGQGAENYSLPAVSYDANGNISSLQRNGWNGSSWGSIDNLSYTYSSPSNGNQLVGVRDFANTTVGQKDNGSSSDYTYWADGSLKSNANKGITNIQYNYLSLPEKIEFGVSIRIENTYDAEGMLFSRKFVNGATTTQTDYMGDLIYENGELKTILHDEGIALYGKDTSFITWSDTLGNSYTDTTIYDAPQYQFFITDHLGNTRLVIQRINDSTAVVQENHYYPFGAVMEGVGVTGDWYRELYQGNELVKFNGYETYDFNLRQYDPWEGRFASIDPVDFYSLSGYAGMLNNPLSYTDKNGDCPVCVAVGIGALIGGAFNGVKYASQDKGFFNGFWRGAITGAVGGLAGYFAPIGILPGLGYGAATGAGTGALGAGLNGENIGRGAIYGGLGGGIFGSVSGGIQASRLGANVWTGYRAPHAMYATTGNIIEGGTPVEYGANSVKKLYNDNFSDLSTTSETSFLTNKNGGIPFSEKGGYLIYKGDEAFAITRSSIWKGGNAYKIYFAKNAFASKEQLALSLTHELGHVSFKSLGLSNLADEVIGKGLLDTEGHVAIQKMTVNLIIKNGWQNLNLGGQVSFDKLRMTPDSYKILNESISHLIKIIR
ncbi:MAG: DUF6443 domain-containing protein [Cytophagales bacterium]|nr:DUF6443 domain-containing protein [Cytophagales bacterium]